MTNRNLLLGRSKPSEKLTREEIAALDQKAAPSRAAGKAEADREEGQWPAADGPQGDLLKFRWSLECPGCGFKVTGEGQPKPGQRLARCGRCKLVLVLGGG